MRALSALLALGLLTATAPAVGQSVARAPAAVQTPANPYRDLFTRWDGANRESLDAEAGTAKAQVTDRDPTDGANHGRGALTDHDSGARADQAGHGRGARRTSCSDRDSGDSAGHAARGPTDGDSGANADAAHCGRGPRRR